jgi:hypothetical protein
MHIRKPGILFFVLLSSAASANEDNVISNLITPPEIDFPTAAFSVMMFLIVMFIVMIVVFMSKKRENRFA